MITSIYIDGFKSFSQFYMEFSPLTVIVGTNASGKSNLFDALRLLANLSTMDLRSAFASKQLRGEVSELFTRFSDTVTASQMHFVVEMLVPRSISDNWGGTSEVKTPRLRYELKIAKRVNKMGYDQLSVAYEQLSSIASDKDQWAKKYLNKRTELWKRHSGGGSAKPYIYTEQEEGHQTIKIRQDGSSSGRSALANAVNQTVLGSINSVDFPHIYAAQQEMSQWNFMQLNPELLREPTRYDANYTGDLIGHAGENLAAALFRLHSHEPYILQKIILRLSSFLPEFTELKVRDDKANKQFVFDLQNNEGKTFSSRVLSEGTLRLLVLCVMLYDDKYQGLLCFEEPENGIHPARMRAMVSLLRMLASDFSDTEVSLRQVIVNSHSPVLLRCLKEEYNDQDSNVSIWFSKLITRTMMCDNQKVMAKVSRITPLTRSFQYAISESERLMTLADAANYLKTEQPDYHQP